MKKAAISLAAIVLLFLVFADFDTGPYSGVYDFKQNPNLVLRIKDDNSFTLYDTIGKTSEFVKGKYKVDDNNITLVPDKNNLDKFLTRTLYGKVMGSKIEMSTLKGEFIKR